jgi:hypothetical protein
LFALDEGSETENVDQTPLEFIARTKLEPRNTRNSRKPEKKGEWDAIGKTKRLKAESRKIACAHQLVRQDGWEAAMHRTAQPRQFARASAPNGGCLRGFLFVERNSFSNELFAISPCILRFVIQSLISPLARETTTGDSENLQEDVERNEQERGIR